LPPNGDYTIDAESEAPDQIGVNKIKSGEYRVFIFGEITYKDIFDCSHWTNFCYVLKTNGTFEIWEAHNDADVNHC